MWPYETSDPFVTPQQSVEQARLRRGLTPEQFALPPILVATFQQAAYQRLLERAGVIAPTPTGQRPSGTEDVVTQRAWSEAPIAGPTSSTTSPSAPAGATIGQSTPVGDSVAAGRAAGPGGPPGSAADPGAGAAPGSPSRQAVGGTGTVGDSALGTVDGVPVALARISVGAPAAALVMEGAIARGVRQVLVVGSAGSLQRHLPIGSTVVVESAEREDGTSHHYLPAGEVVAADPDLAALLARCAAARGAEVARGRSWTIDAPYRETVGGIRRHREAGVLVVEMEAAAIFAVARFRGVRAALVVAVSDELFDTWNPGFGHAAYVDALTRAADAAMDAAAHLGRTT